MRYLLLILIAAALTACTDPTSVTGGSSGMPSHVAPTSNPTPSGTIPP